ncbi:MAG: protoheme IX farnesyltransferase [Deltaproteobacteria bacterium]|nr:MAG: protoheme IX farnesyltransferase [Deltaproteobacteria bacterium]
MSSVPETLELAPERSFRDTLRLYVDITRPRVMALVLFTGLPALGMSEAGFPSLTRMFWVLVGTAFAGGASSALNAYWEREADAKMARTRRRPLPAASVLPHIVLAYGAILTVLSTAILWWIGGGLAAAVGLGTIVFYVGVYTMWLKPRTPQNIVIGGAAGGTAPLIASAAAEGGISLGAWLLFLIIFLWTPPHFWAIAIYRKKEYAAADFPMMPNVIGDQPTRWRSLGYTLALFAVSMMPWWLGILGSVYGVGAFAANLYFLWLVVKSLVDQDPQTDWAVFKGSVKHLALVFLAMLFDLFAMGAA